MSIISKGLTRAHTSTSQPPSARAQNRKQVICLARPRDLFQDVSGPRVFEPLATIDTHTCLVASAHTALASWARRETASVPVDSRRAACATRAAPAPIVDTVCVRPIKQWYITILFSYSSVVSYCYMCGRCSEQRDGDSKVTRAAGKMGDRTGRDGDVASQRHELLLGFCGGGEKGN